MSRTEADGPVFKFAEAKGDRLVIHFDHGDGLKTVDGELAREFWIAG